MSYACASSEIADERKYWRDDNVHEVVLRDMVGRGVMSEVGQESPKGRGSGRCQRHPVGSAFAHWVAMWRFDEVYSARKAPSVSHPFDSNGVFRFV